MVLFPVVNFSSMYWDFGLILAFLAIVIPWRGKVRVGRLMKRPELAASDRLSLYASTIASQWVIAGIVLWRSLARGLHFTELGMTLNNPWKIAWATIGLTLTLCAGQVAGLRKLVQIPIEERGPLFRITEKIMPRTLRERMVFVALATTAGLSEEFLYRGFVFALLVKVFLSSTLSVAYAGFLSSIWFSAAHLYQGRRGIITTFVVGVIFVFVRIYSGSLIPPMVAHAGVDLVVGLCVPRLLKSS
jgi:membrane protease YdiL (CAAX protease family)